MTGTVKGFDKVVSLFIKKSYDDKVPYLFRLAYEGSLTLPQFDYLLYVMDYQNEMGLEGLVPYNVFEKTSPYKGR